MPLETGPFCQMGRTMRIKKLTDSSVLKPGELLVVLHCLSQRGFDALGGLRKSIGTGVVQFYRHRQEPVPWIGRLKSGRLFRRPRTTNERRAHFSNEAKEILESHGVAFKIRQDRNSDHCPTPATIYLFGISEAGKNIVAPNASTLAASIAKSTALPSGIGEIRRALIHNFTLSELSVAS
jgi:hypothetical protein